MKSLLHIALLLNLSCLSTAGWSIFGLPSPPRLFALKNSSVDDTAESDANAFENLVRNVSKNKQYKFGDLTKTVVSSSTKGVEEVVKKVTKNDDYHFGDLTRGAVGATAQGFEGVVRSVTKNEEYQFGDLTRGAVSTAEGIVTYSGKTLSLLREANIHELVQLLNYFWTHQMTYEERVEAFAVFVYLGAIMVLSYSFIANLMQGMVFASAWYKVAAASGQSPLASPEIWSKFLQAKSMLDFVFGGPFLPVRVAATIPWFFTYRKMVVRMAYFSPLREKYPIMNRIVSLLTSWAFANLAFVGGITYLLVNIASIKAGVVPPSIKLL